MSPEEEFQALEKEETELFRKLQEVKYRLVTVGYKLRESWCWVCQKSHHPPIARGSCRREDEEE